MSSQLFYLLFPAMSEGHRHSDQDYAQQKMREKALEMRALGAGYTKIGKALKMARSTVQSIISAFEGRKSVKDLTRKDRPYA